MKPLIVLLGSFGTALLVLHFIQGGWHWQWPARIAMSTMLLLTSSGHFLFTQGMMMMLPPFLPAKKTLIYFTGLLEILAAIGLLIPALRTVTAICLLMFFILILPANVYAALKKINLETAGYDGPGLSYLWFRIPMQLLLLAWVYAAGFGG
ncbi:Uncharacterized membrane protein [Chitinophaga costaii]|uniref:Uncharacterized membrane protein n=1 Tax=Chitinophaga costaii TaxID=1335309 RepID=A0A1C4FMX9_9BACT|nr:hypothetical protein [Chitinophaga costaii]PUZ29946.1 hypothetical protein DCM91_00225 [Chitinophaga costaii]SCC57023.1 Uncharacterized membrane protein [Chitinophaga costaii]